MDFDHWWPHVLSKVYQRSNYKHFATYLIIKVFITIYLTSIESDKVQTYSFRRLPCQVIGGSRHRSHIAQSNFGTTPLLMSIEHTPNNCQKVYILQDIRRNSLLNLNKYHTFAARNVNFVLRKISMIQTQAEQGMVTQFPSRQWIILGYLYQFNLVARNYPNNKRRSYENHERKQIRYSISTTIKSNFILYSAVTE